MPRLLAMFLMMFLSISGARADGPGGTDSQTFQRIISEQIAAFRADDGARAYSYAAPMIRQMFPTPENFMAMVKQGYPMVYRPRSFSFGQAGPDSTGRPTQRVDIVGPDGQNYEAVYTMEQQPDGVWRINGCYLVKKPGLSA